jgi:molybdopterin/thiamine biosynthesis adenylyltransferase
MKDENLANIIRSRAFKSLFPDDTPYYGLASDQVATLEKSLPLSALAIEIAALENDIIPERYVRNFKAFSYQDQIALLKSIVAIIGLGGLGGGVVEILARIGIGTLILIDGDIFEETNLNRQMLSTHNGIGTSKAVAAEQRVKKINSSVTTIIYKEFLDQQNGPSMLAEANVIVDCLDSITTRLMVQEIANKLQKPLVSSALAGSSGQVTTILPGDKGLTLIYGEQTRQSSKGAEKSLGCLPQAVTMLSALECSEVVKVLLNRGALLRNRLLIVDLHSNDFEIMHLL